ncbi:MAG: ubiquitin carboxyl-terminal hydrolase 14 [Candidatus Promineifilaceae bacterium]
MMSEQPTGRPRKAETCEHMNQVQDVTPRTPEGCEECLKMGDSWVHLRLCMVCGHVGCCNNSKNKHASKHFAETGHPIIRSFEPGESWMWCYEDELFIVPRRD